MHKQLSTKLGETKLVLHIEQTAVDVEVDKYSMYHGERKCFQGHVKTGLGSLY